MPTLTDPAYRRHPRSDNWEVRYYVVDGAFKKRRWKGGFPRKFDAELWFSDMRKQTETGAVALDTDGRPVRPEAVTLGQLCDRYTTTTTHKRDRSRTADTQAFARLREAVGESRPLARLTAYDLEQYMARRRRATSPHTSNRELATLKRLFETGIRWGLMRTNPARDIKPTPIPEGEVQYLTVEQQRKVVTAARTLAGRRADNDVAYIYPLVTLALRTGMRRGELLNLRWRNVDLDRGRVTVVSGDGFTTKSGRARVLPLDADAVTALRWWREWFETEATAARDRAARARGSVQRRLKAEHRLASLERLKPRPDGLVFPSFKSLGPAGEQRPMEKVPKSLAAVFTAAGVPAVGLHALRHTFAVMCAFEGVPLAVLSRLLGHADLETTQIYLRFYPDDAAGMVKLPSLEVG